jgi:hypothetical protein
MAELDFLAAEIFHCLSAAQTVHIVPPEKQ